MTPEPVECSPCDFTGRCLLLKNSLISSMEGTYVEPFGDGHADCYISKSEQTFNYCSCEV